MAALPTMNPASLAFRKPDFANHVGTFVNRARELPTYPTMPVCAAAAIVVASVVGAFGTGAMPPGLRFAFWSGLIGLNLLAWQLWFIVAVTRLGGWWRAAMVGALVINLPLPFEIALFLRLVGIRQAPRVSAAWFEGLAISAVILAVMLIVQRQRVTVVASEAIKPGGLLARAGAPSPAALVAIRAEDHYCRVLLADGRSALLHHRFGDALREVEAFDGARIHRSVWVANAGVRRAERRGRAWRLVLVDGSSVQVAASAVPQARARGWLARID